MNELKLIETHCHLDYIKSWPLEEILQKSQDAGIEKIITIAVDPGNLDPVIELAQNNEMVYTTQGIHPHDAKDYTPDVFEKIKLNAKKDKVLAIGEIGLDYHYDNSPRDLQIKALEEQLQLASDLDMPVVIHSRDAEDDTKSILKNFSSLLKRKGVIHSFTASKNLAEFCITEGFYLGFNGIMTFKTAVEIREVVDFTPLDKILFETDAPYLTPIPHRGKENAPFYLPHIAERVGQVKGLLLEDLLPRIYQNSIELFKF